MINYVIYAVTDAGYKFLTDKINNMKKKLSNAGIELSAINIEKDASQLPAPGEGMLVISDDSKQVKRLLDAGYYVSGFYHEKNKNEMFEGASYAVSDVEELTIRSYDEVYRRLAGIPWDILETERLLVRESTVEDVTDFYRIYSEPSITEYMDDLFENPDEERAYMKDYINHMYGFYGFGMWTVIEKAENGIIGRAGLNIREGYELPELGFVIEKEYQRKGYAKEICNAILSYAKEELGFDRVQALVEENNEPSLRLLTSLGFIYLNEVTERGVNYQLMTKEI